MATTVAFGSNPVTNEGDGNVWIQVNRTGDLTGTTNILISEDWARSSTETSDLIFNSYIAGGNITYLRDSRTFLLSFAPGVKSIKIPYSASNDIVSESSERLYFSIIYAQTGTTIGDDDAYIKINSSDPILSINGGLLVEEGSYSTSFIEINHAVNFDVTVKVSTYFGTYKEANYREEGGDYDGLADRLVTIPAGQTKVYVPFLTYQNNDPNDWKYESTEIRIEAGSLPSGVLLGQASDIVTIMDKATVPTVTLPLLSLHDGGLAFENSQTKSYAELSFPTNQNVVFNVSTYFGTYKQANYLGEGGDYNGLIDQQFIIKAGETKADIPVWINQNLDPVDWEYEAFELRIEPNVSGATLDTDSVIINIKDVANWVPEPTPQTPLTATSLQEHASAFTKLESDIGTSSAVAIIAGNKELSNVGKTLELFNLLSNSIKNSIAWFVGSTAYANQEDLFSLDLTERQINIGLRLQSRLDSDQVAIEPIHWTTEEVNATDGLGLRVGDYVDGRLVIHQPWMALDSGGKYISSSSRQGRYGGPDNPSHNDETLLKNSFDWSGVSRYAIVPVDSYMVAFDDSSNIGGFNNGLGNFVTLKAVNKTSAGKEIYLTFAHLKQGTIGGIFKQSSVKPIFVPAGTIIGETGQTGAMENVKYAPYGYPIHLHMQAGTALETSYGNSRYADADIDEIPPVYMLGFNSSNVATINDLGSEDQTGNFAVQDYGFPIGDSDGTEKNVASNILPTIPIINFYSVNPTFSLSNLNIVQGDADNNPFTGTPGDDLYLGKEGYDQVNYFGLASHRANFTVSKNSDGTIKVSSTEFGTDTLDNVEGIWLDDQKKWYTIESLLIPVSTKFTTPDNPVLEGSAGEEIFIGDDNQNWFIGNGGGDTYNGHGGYDQVEYYGPDAYRNNFIFSKNSDESIVAISSSYGKETFISIEGFWFNTEQAWYSIESLTFI